MLEKILSIGLTENMLSYERRRVRAANSVALVLIGTLAVPFTILSWVYFPPVAFLPLLGVVVCGSTLA